MRTAWDLTLWPLRVDQVRLEDARTLRLVLHVEPQQPESARHHESGRDQHQQHGPQAQPGHHAKARKGAEGDGRQRAAQHARLPALGDRLNAGARRRLDREADRLAGLDKLRQSLNPERPLELGFALVRKMDGTLARSASDLAAGERVNLKFKHGERDAVIDGEGSTPPPPAPAPVATAAPKPAPRPKPTPPPSQGDLF
jgi:exonuclease VII large subunit